MKLHSRSHQNAFAEDAFLWEGGADADDGGQSNSDLSEAERIALHLFEAISLPSSLLLEDPNERLAKHLENRSMFNALRTSDTSREVRSDDFASHFYELTPDGGKVALETNPGDSPALVRVAVENARLEFLLAQIFKTIQYVGQMKVSQLEPFPMTENLRPGQMGNKYFRLITDPSLGLAHDVACLVVWAEPEGMPNRIEVLNWPIEKAVSEPKSAD